MNKSKILRTIGGFVCGVGIGICIGITTQNAIPAILIGLGIGICFAVSFNSTTK